MESVLEVCSKVKQASYSLMKLSTKEKNEILSIIEKSLLDNSAYIIEENKKDIANAEANNKLKSFIDRLALSEARINAMAEGIRQIIDLDDPVGEQIGEFEALSGLKIRRIRVPFGVIGIIYEARPNVTADAVGLAIKSGNAVVLRGSKDAINSNKAIVKCMQDALKKANKNVNYIGLIEDTSRDSANALMKANGLIDVLIPRGSGSLIDTVVQNSTVPVIETGKGNCFVYINEDCDIELAKKVLVNAKAQRVSVCNACESLIIDESVAEKYLPVLFDELRKVNVIIYGDEKSQKIDNTIEKATEKDFATEYNDYKISVQVVKNIDEAIDTINKYSTGHSEAIISKNQEAIDKFFLGVDSACLYANASTRFTDGFEFGFGAEMGISTQKLHARGPVGLKELTSYKYLIVGEGQTRG